jgi:hypothetical protein
MSGKAPLRFRLQVKLFERFEPAAWSNLAERTDGSAIAY